MKNIIKKRIVVERFLRSCGYPFTYFDTYHQYTIKTPCGVADMTLKDLQWVFRMSQDRGRGFKQLKKYLKHTVPKKEIKR